MIGRLSHHLDSDYFMNSSTAEELALRSSDMTLGVQDQPALGLQQQKLVMDPGF